MAMTTKEKVLSLARALTTRRLDFEYSGMPITLEHITRKKLLALMDCQINCKRKTPRTPWYPVQLHVETSAVCSLRCPLCPAGMGLVETERKLMPLSTFRKLIDEVGDYTLSALMWGWGEPLLNPSIYDMIAYAHGKNVATIISSNGQQVQSSEEAEMLVSSGLDCLIVSLDGATQESYSQYRVGGDIRKVFRFIKLVAEAKETLASRKPVINVQTVVMKHNEHELQQIESEVRTYGANMVTRVSTQIPDYAGPDADERFAPSDTKYRRFEYRNGQRVRKPASDYHCIRPWDRMTVTWDGRVISCEHDFNATMPFGNGLETSFMDAWWGEKAADFRARCLEDKGQFAFCADCHYRDNVGECLVEVVPFGS